MGRLTRTFTATVYNRVELLGLELQEEGIRFLGTLLLAGVLLSCSALALVMVILTIIISVGEENRLAAAIITTVVLLAGAASSGACLVWRLKNWSPFSATRDELRKDHEWMQSNDSET